MVEFKLTIADAKTGKCVQKTLAEESSKLIGLKIGDSVKGDDIGMAGYEFVITGGSDSCGFPMRKGIKGPRKRVLIEKGVGFRSKRKGMKKRKTVCGENISAKISQINLKITKHGSKPLAEEKAEGKEAAPAEKGEAPAEKPKEKAKAEEKPKEEAPKKEAKEAKPEEKPKAEAKAEAKE